MIEDRDLVIQLAIMSVVWTICAFTYYLGKFQITSVAGDIYKNSIFSSIADAVARPAGYILYKYYQGKTSLTILFAISFIGSFPVMFSENASENFTGYVVPGCLFIMNLGTSATFGNLYMSHLDLFPIVFSATSYGVCNILARALTSLAPIVANFDQPTPEIIFTTLSFIAVVVTLFIRDKTNKYY